MKKIRFSVWILFFIAILFIFTKSSPAMNDPELIQWRATTFNTFVSSAYQAVFGRFPNQIDWNFARQYRQKIRLFWALIGSQEYRSRYGYLTRKYFVYWKTRFIDTNSGRKLCHCYYYAEFSGGYMPSMQYTGVSIPPGKLTKDVARSLVLACAAFDKRTCPHYDCGLPRAGLSNNTGNNNVRDGSRNNLRNTIREEEQNYSGTNYQSSSWVTWQMVPRAGIPGHNILILENISLADAKKKCIKGNFKSFDYERKDRRAYFQDVNMDERKLKYDYKDNPFDHYTLRIKRKRR